MKVIITEQGNVELERLKFNIDQSINNLFYHVPKEDIVGISHLLITNTPYKVNGRNMLAQAAYFRKNNDKPAYIEIYLKNLYSHIKSAESFSSMLPIQEYGLAVTIFHEIGHHVRENRTHNIRRGKSEKYASQYAIKREKEYIEKNQSVINVCLENLEVMAQKGQLSDKIIKQLKDGWQRRCQILLEHK